VHGLPGQGHRVQQLLGVGAQGPAGRRQRQPGATAIEQRHPERALEGLDAGADGRLGDAQGVGGPPEAAEGADRQERLDLGDLH
jgi:hypothetical protein